MLNFGQDGAHTAFTEYQLAVQWADQRVERLSRALAQSIAGWRFEPVVQALLALRGVDVVTAIGLVAEIGDLSRFEHPRKLMGYLGLVPSEHSSGEQLRRGSITKTGNGHARRLLIEAAWCYRFKPRIGRRAHDGQMKCGTQPAKPACFEITDETSGHRNERVKNRPGPIAPPTGGGTAPTAGTVRPAGTAALNL